MRREWFCAVALVLAVSSVSVAGGCDLGSIIAEGSAIEQSAPNVLIVTFELSMSARSLTVAAGSMEEMGKKLEALAKNLPAGAHLSVSSEFSDLTQRSLSFGKGVKITQRHVVTVEGLPPGSAVKTAAALIDGALRLSTRLTVEGITAQLDEQATAKVRARLLREAVEAAREKAKAMATAGGMKLTRTWAVVGAKGSAGRMVIDGMSGGSFLEDVVIRTGFSVFANIGQVTTSADVVARFCAEPLTTPAH